MIRLRRFTQTSYSALRRGYLEAIDVGEIASRLKKEKLENRVKNSNIEETEGGSTSKEAAKEFHRPTWLTDYLFKRDGGLDEKKLEELLAGPEKMPDSFVGTVGKGTMRGFFEDMIQDIGFVALPKDRKSKKDTDTATGSGLYMTDEDKAYCDLLFDYKRLNRKYGVDNGNKNVAYWLMNELEVKTCPYCNRIYTMHIRGAGKGSTVRAEFDHFYPRSVYPYFSISLFNLIPSCGYCNRLKKDKAELFYPDSPTKNVDTAKTNSKATNSKGDGGYQKGKDYSIIYPYEEGFGNDEPDKSIVLRVIPLGDDSKVMKGISEDFVIEFQRKNYIGTKDVLAPTDIMSRSFVGKDEEDEVRSVFFDRAKNSIDIFRLEKLYIEHRKEIARLVEMRYIYSQCGIEMILQPLLAGMRKNRADRDLIVKEIMYFAFLEDDRWGESPLNKLKHDILEQLEGLEGT